MDWIHCNQCFSQLERGITLHLTSCGHMFCNNCLENGSKESTCLVCHLPCSVMKLVPDMKPEIQEYFTDPEEIIKKSCEVLQFQKQHRRRLLSYLLQSTKKFYTARSELKRMSELCQKQHKQLKESQKVIRNLEEQLATHSSKQISPFNISPSTTNLSPGFIQSTPSYKRPAKSTPYNGYQSHLVTPSRISRQRSGAFSASSQISSASNKITSSTSVFTPPTPESAGSYQHISSTGHYSSGSESGYLSNSPGLLSPGLNYCDGRGSKCYLAKSKNGINKSSCMPN